MLSHLKVLFVLSVMFLSLHAKALEPIKISTSNVMPWGIEKKSGLHEGLLVKFAYGLATKLDRRVDNRMRPYPRVIMDISLGKCDLAVMYKGAKSEDIAQSLGTVVQADIIAVSLSDHKPIKDISELAGEQVAHVRGSVYGPSFDDNEQIIKVPVKDMNQGLRMLLKGHVAALVSADQSIFYGIDVMAIDPARLKRLTTISTATADLYLSKKSSLQGDADKIRKALEQMKAEGVLNEIFYSRDYLSGEVLKYDSHSSSEIKQVLYANR